MFRGLTFLGHSVSIYLFNMVTEQRLRFFAHMKMKTIAMQLLVRFASIHQTGNDLQEDPTTRGSEPLNRT